MKLYEVNREERHFGFLLMSALIFNKKFRSELFSVFRDRFGTVLEPDEFDVYAEVAIFRDHWNKFGDYKHYTENVHSKRLAFLSTLLQSMDIDADLIEKENLFWTGSIGTSKLWYPGRWYDERIDNIEKKHEIDNNKLWRCRWLCNAKPDVMIHSKNTILFIEIKVESGMGRTEKGYNQEQTQEDIMKVGKCLISWMHDANIQRINLTHEEGKQGIVWKDVLQILGKHKGTRYGDEMVMRHLSHMPTVREAQQ